jgi:putative nucleotidyltransferase with HDIG domain
MTDTATLVERSSVLRLAREALRAHQPWLVGGTVRDLLMNRPLLDVDLVIPGDAEGAARELARAADAHVFPLSERFGAWRVIAADRAWQSDVTPLRGGSIEIDLGLRDFTINAMALPLDSGAPLIDPHSGRQDLEARVLCVTSDAAYRDDPLRTLRMARFACELDLEVEPATRALAAEGVSAIGTVAAERSFYELRRLIVAEGVMRGIELMDEVGLVAALLPELEALKGVEQNPYHHLDVWGHTLAVLDELLALERDPEPVFGELAGAIEGELARPLADDLTRAQALRLGALLHDAGKPGTRAVVDDRIMFIGHDRLGADVSREICRRFHTSVPLADFLAAIARHHLRLGFLVHERPLSRRSVYRYLRACEPVEVEVTLLSVADRLATRGERTRDEAVQGHLELARELAAEALEWRAHGAPAPPVRGDELIRELALEPGPKVGELLEQLREETFVKEVRTREQALEWARQALG